MVLALVLVVWLEIGTWWSLVWSDLYVSQGIVTRLANKVKAF